MYRPQALEPACHDKVRKSLLEVAQFVGMFLGEKFNLDDEKKPLEKAQNVLPPASHLASVSNRIDGPDSDRACDGTGWDPE